MAKNNILVRSKLKKAQMLYSEGKLPEAKLLYSQLYSKNKTMFGLGLELAVLHRKLGEFKETETICRNILKVAPKNALAHHILGSALQCQDKMDAAIEEYIHAIQLDNKLIEAHYFLGNIYKLTGQLELAAESLDKAVKLKPDFFEALNNLAAVLVELHRPVEAKKVLDKALKIDPDSNQLLCNLANFYMLENNSEKAMEAAQKVYNTDPEFVDALKIMGKIYYKKPDYDSALKFYRKAYEISHDDGLIGSIADILERRGEFEEANKLILPLIEAGKTSSSVLLTYSALSRKFKTQQQGIDAIETKIDNSLFDKPSLVYLHSELGKLYDSLAEYDSAFKNYQQANLLEQELNKEIKELNEIRELENTRKNDIDKWFKEYSSDFWHNLPSSGNDSERPIFVIGMFRSGTTLCEQILSSHPDVQGAGELYDINQLSYSLGNSKLHDKSPASLLDVTQDKLINAANSYLRTLDKHSTVASSIVDKMPANFFHVGLISRLFPNAHIVHMIRDPRDVCLSMYFQRFGAQMTFSTDLVELANYHLTYQRIMQYWNEVLDIKIHNVVYEELMENQEELTRKLLAFCGLDWSEKCINFHQSKRDINTPSYDQVRKPLYKKSVARWKNYEAQIQPLIDSLGLTE